MHNNNFLYNINSVLVKPGLEKDYIEFSKHLNHYLVKNYGKYYIGLDLSVDKYIHNNFTVVAFYKNVPGSYKIQAAIQEDIVNMYVEAFGNHTERIPIYSFNTEKKLLPVAANLVKF